MESFTTLLDNFIHDNLGNSKSIAVVSSGGTSVPLEVNTVRFIENFSTGGRGAASAESFLSSGYCVIFLYRKGSVMPFVQHFQRAVSREFDFNFLDHIQTQSSGNIKISTFI